jgi:hypothetical protein
MEIRKNERRAFGPLNNKRLLSFPRAPFPFLWRQAASPA